jgi:hypothetical protein
MIQKLRAVFRKGTFVLHDNCDLAENTEVQISVEPAGCVPPIVSDALRRQEILTRVVERMQNNPIPPQAPKFSRDDLHERR